MTTRNRRLTEPLETTAAVFGSLFAAALILGAVATLAGTESVGGLGHAQVCVTDPNIGRSSGPSPFTGVYAPKPGAQLAPPNAQLSVCALHPGFGQRVLYSLTVTPQILLWGGILLLLWRLLMIARRGPFTVRVAAAMRVLGWYIIAGSVLAAAIEQLATIVLLDSLLAPAPEEISSVVAEALRALIPVPALAGAALLTFARIVRLGAAMDDEIQGTV